MAENPSRLASSSLPLIIAGPILRRTEATSVTVWMALRQPQVVTLKVLETEGEQLGRLIWETSGKTLQLGQSLHVITLTACCGAMTADSLESSQPLQPGTLYAYDLSFAVANGAHTTDSELELAEALCCDVWPDISVSYFEHQRPTFSLPPAELSQLQIFHGSCRKVHDRGHDALPMLDLAIAHHASEPNQRPHQLFLTGDQIYGDEIAGPLLWAVQQNSKHLFGWTERLWKTEQEYLSEAELHPGQRTAIAEQYAGLTASLKNTPEKAASHLFRFQEYCTAYLLSWSQCGWNLDFPTAAEQGREGAPAQRWDEAVEDLKKLLRSQPHVRRALANVPTYMIFDDHDVSDDWNLNRAWCERVYSKPLGRQTVRNALLAYALFQGWGNKPDQFAVGALGHQLLKKTEAWIAAEGRDDSLAMAIHQLLGLPDLTPEGQPKFLCEQDVERLDCSSPHLDWHYLVPGTCHEVLVLDTRTQRGYPQGDESAVAVPQLLSHSGFEQLKLLSPQSEQKLAFVVIPTNVFSLKLLDYAHRLGQALGREFEADVGDSWNLEEETRAELLNHLFDQRDRVVILSGDIHFSGAIQLDYSNTVNPRPKTLVQLTASAFCNSDSVTGLLHTKLKSFFPEPERYWHQDGAHYRTRWIQRQPTRSPVWSDIAPWICEGSGRAQSHKTVQKSLARLWYGRWLQEGREVVGFNNLGQVQLEQQQNQLAVVHTIHWYAPWALGQMVCSRFWADLSPRHRQ